MSATPQITWYVGPVEALISPPMKNVVTVYTGRGNVAIYVARSPFIDGPPSHNTERIAKAICELLNTIEHNSPEELQ